jgi:hypothetical protein
MFWRLPRQEPLLIFSGGAMVFPISVLFFAMLQPAWRSYIP